MVLDLGPLLLMLSTLIATSSASDLTDKLTAAGLNQFVDALFSNNIEDVMSPSGPVTIIAPTDAAFQAMASSTLDAYIGVRDNPDNLIKVIHYHVIPQKLLPADIKNEMVVQTMSNEKLRFNIYKDVMTANGAPITPVPSLTTDSLAVFTVGKVLLSSGGRDLNGVLDANKKMFSNSIQGIQMAGAGDAIDGNYGYTLFIPPNDAFKAVKESDLFKMLGNPAEMKKGLLKRIVNGTYFLSAFTSTMEVPNMIGGTVKITVEDGTISIDGAKVIPESSDLLGDNGVIHVVDKVLLG